jgi:hypothetical protein
VGDEVVDTRRFALRRAWWAIPFVVVLAPGQPEAVLEPEVLRLRMGLLGSADVPLERIAAVGRINWPWWGGVGVRIARGTVAFVADAGPAAELELSEPLRVRAPLRWRARRLIVAAEDVDGFIRAVADARRALSSSS